MRDVLCPPHPPPPPRHPRERPCTSEKWRRRKTGSRGADKSRHLPLFLSRHAERGRPPATGTCHGFWELLLGGSAREKTEVSGRCPLGIRGVSGAGARAQPHARASCRENLFTGLRRQHLGLRGPKPVGDSWDVRPRALSSPPACSGAAGRVPGPFPCPSPT